MDFNRSSDAWVASKVRIFILCGDARAFKKPFRQEIEIKSLLFHDLKKSSAFSFVSVEMKNNNSSRRTNSKSVP